MDAITLQSTKAQTPQASSQRPGAAANTETADSKREEIVSVAKKFEALMLHAMLKSMRATIVEDELTGSDGQDLYRDMMDQEIAKNISESGGFGIQAVLAQQLGANMGVDVDSTTDNPSADTTAISTNHTSHSKLTQLQQYQEISSANDLVFSTQSSLMPE